MVKTKTGTHNIPRLRQSVRLVTSSWEDYKEELVTRLQVEGKIQSLQGRADGDKQELKTQLCVLVRLGFKHSDRDESGTEHQSTWHLFGIGLSRSTDSH